MNGSDLSGILLQELDYEESPGFISPIIWSNERPIPDISAVYFVQNVPIAYFSQLSYNDPEYIWKLYRHIWSQSKVPLLYVILPQEIHVYNTYADPHAPKFCSDDGELALLAPAKSTILVTSNTHEEFRQNFFERYHMRAVVNFSALRHELFPDSLSPIVALFYRSDPPPEYHKIVYGVPKPSPLSLYLGAIVLDATEVKYLDRKQLLSFPALWKVASWSTPRDAILIDRLKTLPTLKELEKSDVLRGEIKQGFTAEHLGSDKNEALWLQGKPLLDTKKFTSYVAIANDTVQGAIFHRPRTQEIYVGPLALIRRSTCEAAFFEGDFIAYRDKITGVLGQSGSEYLLKCTTTALSKHIHSRSKVLLLVTLSVMEIVPLSY